MGNVMYIVKWKIYPANFNSHIRIDDIRNE